jgi:hypothetical protein
VSGGVWGGMWSAMRGGMGMSGVGSCAYDRSYTGKTSSSDFALQHVCNGKYGWIVLRRDGGTVTQMVGFLSSDGNIVERWWIR